MNIARLDVEVEGHRTTQLIAGGQDGSTVVVVGAVELLYLTIATPVAARRSACIRMLFVKRGFRMQGIGRQLVEEACHIARVHGCETLGLSLAADNYSASEFYKKLGFNFAYEYDDGSMIVSKNLFPVSAIRDPQS